VEFHELKYVKGSATLCQWFSAFFENPFVRRTNRFGSGYLILSFGEDAFSMIDYQNIQRSFFRFDFQTELGLQSRK
jgi:hypothetical protein